MLERGSDLGQLPRAISDFLAGQQLLHPPMRLHQRE
jgi:hypothetical protein